MREYTAEELEARKQRRRELERLRVKVRVKVSTKKPKPVPQEKIELKEPEKILEQPKKTHCKAMAPPVKKSARQCREEHALRAAEFRRKTLEEKQRRYDEYKNERNKIAVPDENHDDGKSESGYGCEAQCDLPSAGESAAPTSESATDS